MDANMVIAQMTVKWSEVMGGLYDNTVEKVIHKLHVKYSIDKKELMELVGPLRNLILNIKTTPDIDTPKIPDVKNKRKLSDTASESGSDSGSELGNKKIKKTSDIDDAKAKRIAAKKIDKAGMQKKADKKAEEERAEKERVEKKAEEKKAEKKAEEKKAEKKAEEKKAEKKAEEKKAEKKAEEKKAEKKAEEKKAESKTGKNKKEKVVIADYDMKSRINLHHLRSPSVKTNDIKEAGRLLGLNLKQKASDILLEIERIMKNDLDIPADLSNMKRSVLQKYARWITFDYEKKSKDIIAALEAYKQSMKEEEIERRNEEADEEDDEEDEEEEEEEDDEDDKEVDEEDDEDDEEEVKEINVDAADDDLEEWDEDDMHQEPFIEE